MAYTNINKSSDYFNTKLWTGTGAENAITGVGFQPDLVWIKNRDALEHNKLYDAVRGATKNIYSNLNNAEGTDAQSLKSFDSDGFTLGTESALNGSGQDIVGWSWLANGAGVSNTDGSITSTVSANTTSGFSIVKYTGNSTAGATIGHGLGVAPKMFIIKNTSDAYDWYTYHETLGNGNQLYLNLTDASTATSNWNNTSPTNSVFTISGGGGVNFNGQNFIAYCFAEKKGFSKFGGYTGNGSEDGTFIYTGFAPAFVIIRITSATGDWTTYDNKRKIYNPRNVFLRPNKTDAEGTSTVSNNVDFLSNGFKPRKTNGDLNSTGNTYIYMAFAEHPLVSSTGVPCTAR